MIVEKDGNILSVHCKCMAGLGESCTHAAALLFTLDTMVQLKKSKTVTQVPCYWKDKPFKEVAYVPAQQIDFRSAKAKRKALNDAIVGTPKLARAEVAGATQTMAATPSTSNVPLPTDEELNNFFHSVSHKNSKTKPAILSLVKGFQCDYEVKKDDSLPPALGDLSTTELLSLSVTKDQIKAVEEKTRVQAKSKIWHSVRRGRLTASILHSAVHTSCDKPAKSVISSVLFDKKVSGKAIDWGVGNEKKARDVYVTKTKDMHAGFSMKECGFFINSDSPFMGASPDGIRECDCCGTVTLEIKCPYKHKSRIIKKAAQMDKDFCLGVDDNGKLYLKENHPYYMQVQAQIFAVEAEYCDFVVWTEADTEILTVMPNIDKWKAIQERAKLFFEKCIIPLLANDKKQNNGGDVSGVELEVAVDVVDDAGGVVVAEDDTCGVVDVCGVEGKTDVCDIESELANQSQGKKPVKACDVVERDGVGNTDVKQAVLSPVKKQVRVECETLKTSTVYCSCKDVEYGRMIFCDNQDCPIGWYHYLCEGLIRKPKGQWYCKMCSELPQYKFSKISAQSKDTS